MPLTHEEIEIVTTKLFKVMDGRQHHHFAMARWLSHMGLLDKIDFVQRSDLPESKIVASTYQVAAKNAVITELLKPEVK